MTKILIDEAVVRQAMEALEYWRTSPETCGFTYKARDATTALRQALEQPAQEPDPDELTIAYMSGLYEGKKRKPWVGLTDEERRHLRKCNQQHDAFALALEALLKEKNT